MNKKNICQTCGKENKDKSRDWQEPVHDLTHHATKIRIYHQEHGCESGCCGHRIEAIDDSGWRVASFFTFSHSSYQGTKKEFVRDITREWASKYNLEVQYNEKLIDECYVDEYVTPVVLWEKLDDA